MARYTLADDVRNAAVMACRVLEWIRERSNLTELQRAHIDETVSTARYAIDRFDQQETANMYFSISASGTKEHVLKQLEDQREGNPDYASLKNQLLEHVAGYVAAAPEGSSSFALSLSVSVSFQQPVPTTPTQPVDAG